MAEYIVIHISDQEELCRTKPQRLGILLLLPRSQAWKNGFV